jgi:hypothetical protein
MTPTFTLGYLMCGVLNFVDLILIKQWTIDLAIWFFILMMYLNNMVYIYDFFF